MHQLREVRRLLLLVCLICAPCGTLAAPPPTGSNPPKTVLVLSGGGARGIAHVGVLEVLEELEIPVDMVIGTSMGAVVGGMYASGLSPAEMRERLEQIDWSDAFNDAPPRKLLPFRRKEEQRLPLFQIEAGMNKDGVSLPSGIVAGQKLNFVLRTMLIHTVATDSFDDLPIPFRAVATDLDSGKMIVIDRGDLPQAIRASMAFPVLFTPVEYEGHLLVDGGVVRNLPIDVALNMGAERIIAVDVGSRIGSMKRDDPSALGVLKRTQGIMSKVTRADQLELIREQDILIEPALDGVVSFTDFAEIDPAIALGREAAEAHTDRLRELAVPGDRFRSHIEKQRSGTDARPITIAEIEVRGAERVAEERILLRIKIRPGDTLDLNLLREDLERVYLIGGFQSVEFNLEPIGDRIRLVIDVEEKSWGPWYLRAGLGLRASFEGEGRFVLTGLVLRPNYNRYGAEWRTFVTVGDIDGVASEFFQPLGYLGQWFVAPALKFSQDGDEAVYLADSVVPVKSEVRTAKFDVGRSLSNWAEIRLGLRMGRVTARSSLAGAEKVDVDTGAYNLRVAVDRIDHAFFPKSGWFAKLEGRVSSDSLGADDDYERLDFESYLAGSRGRNTLVGGLRLGTDLGSDAPFYDDFALGGFLNLSGLNQDQLRGTDVAHGALVFFRQLNRDSELIGGLSFYVGASLEAGNVWRREEAVTLDDVRIAGSLWVGVDSLFGPLYLAYGKAESQSGSWYLFLGRVF